MAVETQARGIGLVDLEFASLAIPDDNRPEHSVPPEAIPLVGWRLLRATPEHTVFRTDLPVRSRAMFFTKPAGDMHLRDADGKRIPHVRESKGVGRTWRWDGEHIDLSWPEDETLGNVTLHYARATQREGALNLAFSPEEPEDFVRLEVQFGKTSRSGLLLPAPGVVEWELTVPEAGELHFNPTIVAPEIADGPPSDGASLVVEVDHGGFTHTVWSGTLSTGVVSAVTADLSRWQGEDITLRLESEPGETETFDYVFIGEPAVTAHKVEPKRVILVFVDTLRPDHLSPYGYERDTSPALAKLAQDGAVFESTRSIAPWTLPSARTVITGRQPEWFGMVPTLAGRFRAEGWATGMFAGNVYLSANFEMTEDWGVHHVENWPGAEIQVDRAMTWLEEQDGRDAFLLLHLMDPHLPYVEPRSYDDMWAGEAPEGLGGQFHLGAVRRLALTPDTQQYVRDRYDQNIRYADDQLSRIYDTLGPNDILVFFSDHGEEFWDHGNFEHGHTLHDELLRVPLVIRGPGVESIRIAEPTSLLDIAPTVLELAGVPTEDKFDGVSLVPAMHGEELATRDLAFGRPLYGTTQWGVIHGDEKYTTKDGYEHLYDLSKDPGEQTDRYRGNAMPEAEAHHQRLGDALETYAGPAYRIKLQSLPRRSKTDAVIEIDVPGGVIDAFGKDDTAGFARLTVEVETISEEGAELDCDCSQRIDRVRITAHKGYKGGTEAFILPEAPMALVTRQLSLYGTWDDDDVTMTVGETARRVPHNSKASFAKTRLGMRVVTLGFAVVPAPPEGARELKGHDSEIAAGLEAMGYTVSDEDEVDLCEDDPNKLDPGVCGCGVPDTDRDRDRTPDCKDACPDDRDKTTPGTHGCGAVDIP